MLEIKQSPMQNRENGAEVNGKRTCPLTPAKLRRLWGLIEETQSSTLLNFSDSELVQELIGQMEAKDLINTSETKLVRAYLHSRLLLIRDFAHARTQPA
ncbi:hypothetical protein [Calothrix sp. NIES-3974]|uniref:hypothetical protein n=1 Tax=Calothrix sp. NIES-3974 TaxID=2005462 RepID=UPI000B607AC2|nr:hypothetical protein [Calothrix sp. NIES-3974]BAZ07055.1 hypothetical protein NIES3974_37170 [Calothrix sp. NIES-3974]